ncbi:MAG: aldolase [Candidatus Velthaea sp.]
MIAQRPDVQQPTGISDAAIDALSIPQQMAIAMALLERGGFCQDVAGQIVVRDPAQAGTYWTNPWGYTWEALRASDMLHIDERMNVLEANRELVPSRSLELQFGILRKRADVNAVVHNHPIAATAWSSTNKPLRALDQTSSLFFKRQAWCAEFEDVEQLYDPAEFGRTGEALGPKAHVLWMVHHGVIVAHKNVPYMAVYALYLERSVQLNLAHEAAGGGPALDAKVARKMRDLLQQVFVIPDSFRGAARSIIAARPDVLA